MKKDEGALFITTCPYCFNKSKAEINDSDGDSTMHTCPHCRNEYKILIKREVTIHSEGLPQTIFMQGKIQEEIDEYYKRKKNK